MLSIPTAVAVITRRLPVQYQVDSGFVEGHAAVQTVQVEGVADVLLVHFAHIVVVRVVAKTLDPRLFPTGGRKRRLLLRIHIGVRIIRIAV